MALLSCECDEGRREGGKQEADTMRRASVQGVTRYQVDVKEGKEAPAGYPP